LTHYSYISYDPGLPGNATEMVWTALVYFCSIFISSMILGNILTYLVRLSPIEVAHKERIEALRVYMEKKQLLADLHDSVIRYCQFQYKKKKESEDISGNDLFKALSRSLRIEVANAYHSDVIQRCSQIGRPFHRCSQAFFDELVTKLYTVHVMPGDHIVHKDEIPRELYFVASGTVQVVDEHDQVVSVIRSDVPDAAPIVGEVPFFLGINYMKAMIASLDGDVQLEVLSKQSLAELNSEFPADCKRVCENLWLQFDIGREDMKILNKDDDEDGNLDREKLLTKRRILESAKTKKEREFNDLCTAVRSGDLDKILLLLRQGADLNQADYDGRFVCVWVCVCVCVCVCVVLQINSTGACRTAMHLSTFVGRYKVVEALLKWGIKHDVKDRWGQTPMAIAVQGKQQMIISVLASAKAKLEMSSPELALCTAAGTGDLLQVKRLVEFGVPADACDYDMRTALHVAAAEGFEQIVEFLVMSQADPNCKDRWGGSPLQDALSGHHIPTAQILKAKGALVPDTFGSGAVCAAAGQGDVQRLRVLHSFGQSLDVGDYDDRYPLHLVAEVFMCVLSWRM